MLAYYIVYTYKQALNSLKKYPLPLVSGQEAKILDHIGITHLDTAAFIVCKLYFVHIGEKLAKKLDKKLMQYRANEGMPTSDDAGCTGAELKKKPKLATPDGEANHSSIAPPKKRKVM